MRQHAGLALRGMFQPLRRRTGWIAVIVDDEEEADVGAYVVTYCPACAKREFGFVGRLPAPLRRENTPAIPENPPRFVWARSGPTRSSGRRDLNSGPLVPQASQRSGGRRLGRGGKWLESRDFVKTNWSRSAWFREGVLGPFAPGLHPGQLLRFRQRIRHAGQSL
jgi:hypothetical protein